MPRRPRIPFHSFFLEMYEDLLAQGAKGTNLRPFSKCSIGVHIIRMDAAETLRDICEAAREGDLPTLRRLLAAAPELAAARDRSGWTPLIHAAIAEEAEAARVLLEAAPAAAALADSEGWLPLHFAALTAHQPLMALLLAAHPAAASAPIKEALFPLHIAAGQGSAGAVQLLLEAAPAAASARGGNPPRLPLEMALTWAAELQRRRRDRTPCVQAARTLLPATLLDDVLAALLAAGALALPLFADLVACRPLSPEQWQRVPAPCPGLGAALPTVLARSAVEAGWLVGHLSPEERQRLRTAALSLGRAQRVLRAELPAALVAWVLALAAAP